MTTSSRWRTTGGRVTILGAVIVVALTVSGFTVLRAIQDQEAARRPTAATVRDQALDLGAVLDRPHVVFRSTAPGPTDGRLAAVPLDDPGGDRSVSGLSCERVYATGSSGVCLSAERGAVTRYRETLLGPRMTTVRSLDLNGIPSRARMSTDGSLVSTTVFVSGHSYATLGFSTETVITDVATGVQYGNLEKTFRMVIDARRNHSPDLNIWGVTFPRDPRPRMFYATVSAGGVTWLARGDLQRRTLTAIRPDAECPSISPDGRLLVYKKRSRSAIDWRLHVLDLETGRERALPERRNVDDQVEWLDNQQVLYAVPRSDQAGSDIWVSAVRDGRPRVLIPHGSSPAVVR